MEQSGLQVLKKAPQVRENDPSHGETGRAAQLNLTCFRVRMGNT